MRYNKFFISAAALAIVFFFNISSVLAGGPGGGVLGVDTVLKIAREIITHEVKDVRFAPDDSYIISCGNSTNMRIYDTNTGAIIDTIESGSENFFNGFIFSRSGRYLIAKTGAQVNVYDAHTRQLLKVLKDTSSAYTADLVDISIDDRFIAMTSQKEIYKQDKKFYCIWDWQIGQQVKREEFPLSTPEQQYNGCYLTTLKFSLDGNCLWFGGYYTYKYQNKTYSTDISRTLKTGSWDTTQALFILGNISKSGQLSAYYMFDTLYITDAKTNAIIRKFEVLAINQVFCISSNDKYATLNSAGNGMTYIFNIENGELIAKYGNSKYGWYGYSGISTSNDDKYIIASLGNYIYLLTPPWESIGIPTKPDETTTLYPNPTSGDITVELVLNIPTQLSASFIDTKGTIVKKQNLGLKETGKILISTSEVPSGAYTLLISGEGYNKTFRMVVAR